MTQQIDIGTVGVCLDDSGTPVRLYVVDTIWHHCGTLEVFSLADDFGPDGLLLENAVPRSLHSADFWPLV